mgnify:CR=1 FL=1
MAPAPGPNAATRLRLDREQQARAVLDRYARLSSSGRPVMCGPVRATAKVVYDDEAAAQHAADELHQIYGGVLYPYPCERSRHGHYHHTSQRPQATDQREHA